MTRTAIFQHSLFLEHDPGPYHVEIPQRLAVIYEQLQKEKGKDRYIYPEFAPASPAILQLNHSAEHVARVAATSGRAFDSLDPDTQTSPRSYDAACLAAGAVVRAAEMLAADEADNCFALVRPPGHHAEANRAMGFCLFNNIAVAAHYARQELGLERILIVDWDLHHGNGTQNSFYDTNQVFYFSTHQYPYYPGSGGINEVGKGRGEGFTINVPLRGGQGDAAYYLIFNEILAPIARQYRPELIMVSAGFDIYAGDPLGGMAVSAAGFGGLTRILKNLAREVCHGRLLLTLEGGYNLPGLRDGVMAVLAELSGPENLTDKTAAGATATAGQLPVLEQVRNIAKKYWNL